MFLWNLNNVEDLEEIRVLDGSALRKSLRLAEYSNGKLYYVQPLRIRKGWINSDQYIIDARSTNRPYGASDALRPVPPGVIILARGETRAS
jgi:hypothetical protein